MNAPDTPEEALAHALHRDLIRYDGGAGGYYSHTAMLATLRAAGWDVTRAPPDLARIKERAYCAGIAFAEARHRQAVMRGTNLDCPAHARPDALTLGGT